MQQDRTTNLEELNKLLRNKTVFPAAEEQAPSLKGAGQRPWPGSQLFVSVTGVSDPIVRNDNSWP